MSVSQDIEDRLALLCLFVVRLYLPYTGFKFWGSSHPPVSDSRLIQLQVYTCHCLFLKIPAWNRRHRAVKDLDIRKEKVGVRTPGNSEASDDG